jgi:hypothetical protein
MADTDPKRAQTNAGGNESSINSGNVALGESIHWYHVALIVKVTVAAYVPVAYWGSSVRVQATEPVLPATADLAPAPNVVTEVPEAVLAVCDPEQAVPGLVTVQVYASVSPALGGVATDGPPVGLKSVVTFNVMVPFPVVVVVRIL